MAISKGYNGWSAGIRKVRGDEFYRQVKKGIIKPKDKCELCGYYQPTGMTWHAEEYGPSWEDYVEGAKYLCPTCHGMIHFRFKFINRWKRYKCRVFSQGQHMPFPNLNAFFQYAKDLKDIPYHADCELGIWVDALPLTPYTGPPKEAMILTDHGLELDPKFAINIKSKE